MGAVIVAALVVGYLWGTEMIGQDPDLSPVLLTLMAASRNLERIADQATNIAEEVIDMVEGKIVRHSEGNGHKH